jgi:hypothetical protein
VCEVSLAHFRATGKLNISALLKPIRAFIGVLRAMAQRLQLPAVRGTGMMLTLSRDHYLNKEQMMKRILTHSALAVVLALCALTPAVSAKTKHKKPSAEHVAAVKKCNEDYSAAMKDAKTKKGTERKQAQAAASKAKKDCMTSAPK